MPRISPTIGKSDELGRLIHYIRIFLLTLIMNSVCALDEMGSDICNFSQKEVFLDGGVPIYIMT